MPRFTQQRCQPEPGATGHESRVVVEPGPRSRMDVSRKPRRLGPQWIQDDGGRPSFGTFGTRLTVWNRRREAHAG